MTVVPEMEQVTADASDIPTLPNMPPACMLHGFASHVLVFTQQPGQVCQSSDMNICNFQRSRTCSLEPSDKAKKQVSILTKRSLPHWLPSFA